MQSIAALLFFLQSEQTPVIDGAIAAVLLAFSVVVGVALERLLTKEAWNIASGYEGKYREVFYWLVLTVGITLAIRFLVGSYVHLHMTYAKSPQLTDLLLLLKDLIFLFAFGSFLVRMAYSNSGKDFLGWILIFSCADILWCGIELIVRYGDRAAERLAWAWFAIGLFQLAVTAVSWRSLLPEPGSSRNFKIFIFLAIISLIIFGIDLWGILIGSRWYVFTSHPC